MAGVIAGFAAGSTPDCCAAGAAAGCGGTVAVVDGALAAGAGRSVGERLLSTDCMVTMPGGASVGGGVTAEGEGGDVVSEGAVGPVADGACAREI